MNGVSDYIVAIDLGSTKIVGSLGKKEGDGKIRILSMEQTPVKTEVSRGVIHNIEEVSKSVLDLVQLLSDNEESTCKIDQVYVGLNGYTIRTEDVSSTTYLSGDELVNESHLDELSDDAQTQISENLDVMDIFTQEFLVDGKSDLNPVGSMPQRVEGHYKIVGGKSAILKNLETCFERIDLHYDTILGPVASAEAILRPEDKSKGSVAIDFGAETTSICIYKGNLVRYVAVLPFGGSNITKDLSQLNIDEEEAETIKLNKGTAIHYSEQISEDSQENVPEKMSDFDKSINDIMVARVEEIVENIWAQIRYSGIDPLKLTEGIVLTGGTSQMPGLTELLNKKTDMPVRIGDPGQYLVPESADLYGEPGFSLVIGLLLLGKEGCCSIPKAVPVEARKSEIPQEQTLGGGFDSIETDEPLHEKPKKPEKIKKPEKPKKNLFGNMIKNLFDDEDL
ncbi:MAG: cell division protein FtsA [Bacteroidales bacterium]|nr:cell division protein FtsA [Bacteroidales bacterium]